MKILSLFSGCGGLDLGLCQAGNKIVWANDFDEYAVTTYKNNIGNHIVLGDIKNIDIDTLPNCDVVVGGFPCQGFSMANMKRSVDDERNTLYRFFYNAIKLKQPKYFIAENVKGILNLGKGEVIKQIQSDFENAGYVVSINPVNMADYGVPQTRQRVIIIGQRKDIGNVLKFEFPLPSHSSKPTEGLLPWVTIKEAIEDLPNPDMPNAYKNHIYSAYKLAFRNFTGHRPTDPNKPSPTILARGNGKGGVCAIPHYNGMRRLSIRESARIQTFPDEFIFYGTMNACYRQIGNAVPVKFARLLGDELIRLEKEENI